MKVLVTGATGTAGSAIVDQCLADERITQVFIVARRAPGPAVQNHAKAVVMIHEDFSQWPDELLRKLEGVEACLWAIGGRVSQFNNDVALARRVGVDFTLAAASAMRAHLAPLVPRFRFVFCSGLYSEWDASKRLLFLGDSRRIKGEVEQGLLELGDRPATRASSGENLPAPQQGGGARRFEVYVLRPGGLLAPDEPLYKRMGVRLGLYTVTTQLGSAMIKVAVEGADKNIVENGELLKW